VKLVALSKLKPQRFPVDGSGEGDPNVSAGGTYLVLAVNLIAKCEDYEPTGILLWLPVERRYGAWDSDHFTLEVFSEDATWDRIVEKPIGYLEASLGGRGIRSAVPATGSLVGASIQQKVRHEAATRLTKGYRDGRG
jgi:hypothetical protein